MEAGCALANVVRAKKRAQRAGSARRARVGVAQRAPSAPVESAPVTRVRVRRAVPPAGPWRGRSVFVTGGNGLLGSHLVKALLAEGAKVACLLKEERLSCFSLDGLEKAVARVNGTIEDFDLLCGALRAHRVDTIFHLAAQPIIGEARLHPLPALETNVRGTYHLLEAARRCGKIRSFCAVSSDKVYGTTNMLPYAETDHLAGVDLYDASKVCTDVLARSYAHCYKMPIAVARMGNLYGPGDLQWSRIIPGTVRSLFLRDRPVIRSDGTPLRDYFYVEDAAAALALLGLGLIDRRDIDGQAFNFGTGVPTKVIDVVEGLIRRADCDLRPRVECGARDEIPAQYLDCSKARRVLGWEPKTNLELGLDLTWSWYKRFFEEHGHKLGVGA